MKKLLQYAILMTVPAWIGLEVLGLLSPRIVPSLFASPNLVAAIEAVDAPRLASFTATVGSATLGWDNRAGSIGASDDCAGGKHVTTYDGARTRTYNGYDATTTTAILVGDSYTHGDEGGDDNTIAAQLWREHGIMAANLGVAGYSPLQAVIKAKEQLPNHPTARTIVLGVMYENIRRNVNGYVPIWLFMDGDYAHFIFGLRPHVAGDVITLLQSRTFDDLAAFKAQAKASVQADFWARPAPQFPYSISLLQALASNSSLSRFKARLHGMRGSHYEGDYRDQKLTVPLFKVIQDFFLWAQAHDIQPIVAFFPQNRLDRTSAALWISDFAPRLPPNGQVVDARLDDTDWTRFNVRGDPACHPSSYGYGRIAAAYAAALAPPPALR